MDGILPKSSFFGFIIVRQKHTQPNEHIQPAGLEHHSLVRPQYKALIPNSLYDGDNWNLTMFFGLGALLEI